MNDRRRPSTTTIKVIVRHGTICKRENPGLGEDYRKCHCRKSIYIRENGKHNSFSAGTRIWEEAEKLAQEERDKRDPDKQKVKELEARLAAKETEAAVAAAATARRELTIAEATDRWRNAQKGVDDGTANAHRWVANRIQAWAKDNNIETVAEVTPDKLSKWREEWSPVAEKPYSRLEPATQVTFQSYLKGVFRYIASLRCYIDFNPAEALLPIKVKGKIVHPLSPRQFEDLLATIPICCTADNGNMHAFAAELRALCLFQRWSGLRIGDAVALPRAGLAGNRFTLTTQKTEVLIKDRAIPDLVAAELASLSEDRPGFKKGYFFWPESISNLRSLECTWERYLGKLNSYLNFTDEIGKPMPFHSHMLRHTFAVQHLLQGTPLEEVCKLLTHESIATTERYYAPWVKDRLEKLDRDSVAAMRKMGMAVSTMDLLSADEVHNVRDMFIMGLARTGMVSPQQLNGVASVVNGLLGIESRPDEIPLFCNPAGGAQSSNCALPASSAADTQAAEPCTIHWSSGELAGPSAAL